MKGAKVMKEPKSSTSAVASPRNKSGSSDELIPRVSRSKSLRSIARSNFGIQEHTKWVSGRRQSKPPQKAKRSGVDIPPKDLFKPKSGRKISKSNPSLHHLPGGERNERKNLNSVIGANKGKGSRRTGKQSVSARSNSREKSKSPFEQEEDENPISESVVNVVNAFSIRTLPSGEIWTPTLPYKPSLTKSYVRDMLGSTPPKVQQRLLDMLALSDLKSCRLVSRSWNSLIAKCLKFHLVLTDATKFFFRDIPTLDKLNVTKVTVGKVTRIDNPLKPKETILNSLIKSPENVAYLEFGPGTSSMVQSKLLSAFQWVKELYFIKIGFPSLPPESGFSHLKKLEIRAKDFDNGEETTQFLNKAEFPLLEELRLEFYARNDLQSYLGAHFFVARHWTSIKKLVLNFGYYLTDLDGYMKSLEEKKRPNLTAIRNFKADKRYKRYLDLIFKSRLTDIEIDLSINEGTVPWSLSLEMLDAQTGLEKLVVRHPIILRNYNFQLPLLKNGKTLIKVAMPCITDFDCSSLRNSLTLRSFSIGKEFSFNTLFHGARGRMSKFADFPRLETLRTLSICVPMSKPQITWISNNIPAHSLLLYGMEKDKYGCNEIMDVMEERPLLRKLMMRVFMKEHENDALRNYLNNNDDLILMDYFYEPNSGSTTFNIETGRDFEMESEKIERLYLRRSTTSNLHDYYVHGDAESDNISGGQSLKRRPPYTA